MEDKVKKYIKWGVGGLLSLLILWVIGHGALLAYNTQRIDVYSDSKIDGIYFRGTFDGEEVDITSCEALRVYIDRVNGWARREPLLYSALPDADKLERVETLEGCFIIKYD